MSSKQNISSGYYGGITQIWTTGQNFDRVRQAYHVYEYLTRLHKESQIGGDPTSYQEFVADALANGNYAAAFTAYFRALFGTSFVLRYTDANGKRAGSHVLSRRTPLN